MTTSPLHFITLEGTEGSGKTTQIDLLKARLQQRGDEVISVREPGGTALGEALREILKFSPAGRGICPEAELLLFEASRAELISKIIAPALKAGTWVISDRFTDSTHVYQGCARQLSTDVIDKANDLATFSGQYKPAITLFLDISYAQASARIRRRRGAEAESDRFEAESEAFFHKVIAGYQSIADEEPERFRRVDASRDVEAVSISIWEEVSRAFCL
ncbi:MAG: dTMP kinase [Candidatus Methylacidiphilales bacterium]